MATHKKWRTKEAVKAAEEAALKALHTGGESILTEAIDETPIETGTLRRSGTVTTSKKEKAVYISFNTPYARRQHEELGYHHPRGGKAKYLEDPFNRNKKKVLQYAEKQIKKALKEGK